MDMPDTDDARRWAPAVARNREAILDALGAHVPQQAKVLEIASGSGEHAVFLAPRLDVALWQTSDPDPTAQDSIRAWIADTHVSQVHTPLTIDTRTAPWPLEGPIQFDVMVAINMIHIAPWAATEGLICGAEHYLAENGVLYLYGPFKRQGVHTAPSNASFDDSLRSRDPSWGVRDLDEVTALAQAHGFIRQDVIEMPANNLSVFFKRTKADL